MTQIPIPLEVWRKRDEWRRVVEVHMVAEDGVVRVLVAYIGNDGNSWARLSRWLAWAKDAERDT